MKRILSFCFFLWASCLPAIAQNLTGIWKGYFITEMGEQYKLEFQVKQAPSKTVTGVSYSYLDTRFYGKSTMSGNFFKQDNSFTIQELRTVEVRNMGGGGTCLMNYKFTYSQSGKEEFLEGTYVGKSENRLDPKKNGKWGDCGGGTVFLRRVMTSDFYTEPFLKPTTPTIVKPSVPEKKVDTVQRTTTAKKNAPVKRPPPVATTKKQEKTTTIAPPVVVKKDTPVRKTTEVVVAKPAERPKFTPPPVIRERKNELTQTLTVSSSEIGIRLYDNGEIDDDTISVYLDGALILAKKKLSASPITYTLKMDENNPEHTLVMVAENLGRIPPNTSLMIVQDGDKRYQVSITSTEQKNAMVRFRYQKDKN